MMDAPREKRAYRTKSKVYDDPLQARIKAVPARKLDCGSCHFYKEEDTECSADIFCKSIGLPGCEEGYNYKLFKVSART